MLLTRVLQVCEEEVRRAIEAIVALHEYVRELDEQVLRSLGVILRGPRE
jgi:hypothetical protein